MTVKVKKFTESKFGNSSEYNVRVLKQRLEFVCERLEELIQNGRYNASYTDMVNGFRAEYWRLIAELRKHGVDIHTNLHNPTMYKRSMYDKIIKKIIDKLELLFLKVGLKKVWDNINGIIKYTAEATIVSGIIIISLIFAVYIKRDHESIGESILVFIISVLVFSLTANLVFSLKQFFIDTYNMIISLIDIVKNKFK